MSEYRSFTAEGFVEGYLFDVCQLPNSKDALMPRTPRRSPPTNARFAIARKGLEKEIKSARLGVNRDAAEGDILSLSSFNAQERQKSTSLARDNPKTPQRHRRPQ